MPTTSTPTRIKLILASSSVYRAELLKKLHIPFSSTSPNIDETPRPNESPSELVKRLSECKAEAVLHSLGDERNREKGTFIIGSDQVALCRGNILGKPGTHEAATEQLLSASGQTLEFLTGICLLAADTQESKYYCETTQVKFRTLRSDQINKYLTLEQPYQCAGSFKSEAMGVTLIDEIKTRDPNALIGLPIMGLQDLLLAHGIELPQA